MTLKIRLNITTKLQRYDINWPRLRNGHTYIKYKKCLAMMMLICIKQHLSNIWSSIHEKISNAEADFWTLLSIQVTVVYLWRLVVLWLVVCASCFLHVKKYIISHEAVIAGCPTTSVFHLEFITNLNRLRFLKTDVTKKLISQELKHILRSSKRHWNIFLNTAIVQ